jgi:hypothetical protein
VAVVDDFDQHPDQTDFLPGWQRLVAGALPSGLENCYFFLPFFLPFLLFLAIRITTFPRHVGQQNVDQLRQHIIDQ